MGVKIGLIGDHSEEVVAHRCIPAALDISRRFASLGEIEIVWLSTRVLSVADSLDVFDGFWCVPGSPYLSLEGALIGIRYAREHKVPFLGTCGGFQHSIIEIGRHVCGMQDVDHAESSPGAKNNIIELLACPLVEKEAEITLSPYSIVYSAYRRMMIKESCHCRFGLNKAFQSTLCANGLRVTGWDEGANAHVVELENHPFFVATLFQPERSARLGEVNPLVSSFLQAVFRRHASSERNSISG